jgi:hypothetical protein
MSCLKMLVAAAVVCPLAMLPAMAQQESGPAAYGTGTVVIVPQSSIARPEDAGVKAHTNTMILVSPKPHEPLPAPVAGVVVVHHSDVAATDGGGVKAHADSGSPVLSKQTLPESKLDDGAGSKD